MKRVLLIGAGQLGSRHLQALAAVKTPLEIFVVDPSEASLKTAQQRYGDVAGSEAAEHRVHYRHDLDFDSREVDLSIIATTSRGRRQLLEELLSEKNVGALLVEKILFDRLDDYDAAASLLEKKGIKAWVNCSMRVMPFYRQMREHCFGKPISYRFTAGQCRLATSLIHYLDHIAFLTGCRDYELDLRQIDPALTVTPRKDMFDFHGSCTARFANGSVASFTSFREGQLPILVEVTSDSARYLSRETEGLAWASLASSAWAWKEIKNTIPFQSKLTNQIAEEIFSTGTCALTEFPESVELHKPMIRALLAFLNETQGRRYDHIPFT